MAAPIPPLVIPAAATLTVVDGLLQIRHQGDIVLDQGLGPRISLIQSGGDVVLRLPTTTGSVLANGTLRITGAVDADTLRAREIILGDQPVRARAIIATERLTIGAAHLTVETIVAPEIRLHPEIAGRVLLLEHRDPLGPHNLQGALRLPQFAARHPDAVRFLQERGLPHLARLIEQRQAESAPRPDAAVTRPEPPRADPPRPPPVARTVAPATGRSARERWFPLDQPPIASAELPERELSRVQSAVSRMLSAYGDDPPAEVETLAVLVDQRRWPELAGNLEAIWLSLIRRHTQGGQPLAPAAAFTAHLLHAVLER